MTDQPFAQFVLLLGAAVLIVATLHRLRIPSSLGYLLVGIVLGPHTGGPVVEPQYVRGLAEFGIVFLLFTIGLNFSLPQIYTLRHLVLGLGTAQIALTAAVVGVAAWLAGIPGSAAFAIGAVFAQSSTTIISKQLAEQGEDQSRHGRLAVAMSVFQDVTAVPFVVILPVLGTASAQSMAGSVVWAIAKAILVFVLLFLIGRRLLRPLFHEIASRRSPELFTLTVLFVTLAAAWITSVFELSMAFGAFLAGMVLGDTEFRHQIESTIRPFRDVLLGLFFISIGMLFEPAVLPAIWYWALLGAAVLLGSKTLLVAQIVQIAKIDSVTAWRTAIVLAVGGEFGFALLAIALNAGVIAEQMAQTVLTSVLFSMIAAPLLIRYNQELAPKSAREFSDEERKVLDAAQASLELRDHVIICGYGRIGQGVAHFLDEEKIPYVALDLDPARVRDANTAGAPVYYGDSSEPDILEAVGLGTARLIVVSHNDAGSALRLLHHVRRIRPELPVMVRTRDEGPVEELRKAGATEVVPETVEAGMMIVSHALMLLKVPLPRVFRRMQEEREGRYRLLREFFRGNSADWASEDGDNMRTVSLDRNSYAVGRTLADLELEDVLVTAVVRGGKRILAPKGHTELAGGDVVVLSGSSDKLLRAESRLLG
jgi:CPA2 family monovalent cation:H+ antiporter-2